MVHDGHYRDAMKSLQDAVTLDPSNRALRLALLEAVTLSRDYATAATQATTVSPLVTGEELSMFYAAIAMHETGKKEEARRLMEKARPRMAPGPLVDYYVRAILGH